MTITDDIVFALRPPDVPGFIGREAELAYFKEKLRSERLAIITGAPGIGKTTLAAANSGRNEICGN
jgi:MoxR-like ATPase